MHNYTTIIGVITLRLNDESYGLIRKRYRIGASGIALIMERFMASGLSIDDLKEMPPEKVEQLIYPTENFRHRNIPYPDFKKIHEQMITMRKHAD